MRTGIFGDKNVEDVVGVEVLHILFVWLLLHIFQHFYNVNFFKGKIQTCGFLPLKFFKKTVVVTLVSCQQKKSLILNIFWL